MSGSLWPRLCIKSIKNSSNAKICGGNFFMYESILNNMENGICGKCGQTVIGKLTDDDGMTYRSNKATHVDCYPNPTNSKKCRFCHSWVGKILDDAGVEWRLPIPEHVLCYDEYEFRKSANICEYCNQSIPSPKKKCPKWYEVGLAK